MNNSGGGDIDVESLSVTENGSYNAGEGKAYNPVIVNVQPDLITKSITQNGTYQASSDNADGYSSVNVNVSGYKITEVSGLPSPIATFSDGANLPMPKLKIAVEPQQSGSGDPSPTNIRPISGWSAVDVTIQDDIDNPTTTETITIQLGDTYYGGTLDVVSGVLTVDRQIVDLGTKDYSFTTYGSSTNVFVTYFGNMVINASSQTYDAMCSDFKVISNDSLYGGADGALAITFTSSDTYAVMRISDSRYNDASAFKTAMNGVKVVYKLATPLTIQLTPTAIKSLTATNNLFADTGDVVEASYFESL